ncbi:hypothetical protein IW137_000417 [Coemansia sp. RSA 1287]|nr:hypothetical protein EV176_004834 [Coemansia sp. RSA 451]KAJ2652036.1 hypothetical protein IW137_000417 [Coemansia sp. RSA 1287]
MNDPLPHSVVFSQQPSVITYANAQTNINNTTTGMANNHSMSSQPLAASYPEPSNYAASPHQHLRSTRSEMAHNAEYSTFGYNDQSHSQPVFDMDPHNYTSAPLAPIFPAATPYPGPQLSRPNIQSGFEHNYPYAAFDQSAPHYSHTLPQQQQFTGHTQRPESQVQSEKQYTDATGSEADRPNTFVNRLVDSIRNITLSEAVPIATLFGAALFHHYRNRKSSTMVPYEAPRWVKYAKNAVFAYNCYGFAQNNGFIKSKSRGHTTTARDIEPQGTRSLAPHNSNMDAQDPVTPELVQHIVSQLFRSNLDTSHNPADSFDASWAVPRHIAESHYKAVYYAKTPGLTDANAVVLGGAAAIKAVRTQRMHPTAISRAGTSEFGHEHMLLDFGLREAIYLLSCKAESANSNSTDHYIESLETVGKIALATIIKINIDRDARQR